MSTQPPPPIPAFIASPMTTATFSCAASVDPFMTSRAAMSFTGRPLTPLFCHNNCWISDGLDHLPLWPTPAQTQSSTGGGSVEYCAILKNVSHNALMDAENSAYLQLHDAYHAAKSECTMLDFYKVVISNLTTLK
ncbi:hypothetical protein PHLCEN_2v2631 [Hermanssonia centrifuga]|uniref:Uncharacterized protein n=1 Tax=Hermanssonia centrifuga TaxID=98765 RepID=A0A2R6RIL7_9APHY|nr:hypothetical protein PHLCEN_2v2631 [Hermanssonia centrifuga]